ncbi:GIY-YIG nuclease family protein, partial [Lacimicrobium alkaliphilum]|uniref:GIY-YIG domain-containing protein n=1 Tax=Lacimicrobium alkaliphilum TaxID=1526571 RepID=A0ABQ1RUA1_9ALTE
MFYVYLLQCETDENQFYIGSTKDLRKRLLSHNAGENNATKGHQWKLVYYEAYLNEQAARAREKRLKHHGKTKQALMIRIREMLGFTQP